jgi:archaellum component FlaC
MDTRRRRRHISSMTDELESLILVYLRRIDEKVDRVIETQQDHGRRLTSLEGQVAGLHADFAGQSARIDRIEARLERIEKRLNLIEA